jgi:hypothetical protein
MRQFPEIGQTSVLVAFVTVLITTAHGCNQSNACPEGASPVVSPDSEQGRRAIAETETFFKIRQAQETKARASRRKIDLPTGE